MTVYGLLVALMLVMKLAPDSPLGRWLLLHCVEKPMAQFARMERHHLIYVAIIAGFLFAGTEIVALGGFEVIAPYALEVSIYLDAVMVTMVVSALATARQGGCWVKFALALAVRRMRPRTKRSARRSGALKKPSNDDDRPAVAWSIAA